LPFGTQYAAPPFSMAVADRVFFSMVVYSVFFLRHCSNGLFAILFFFIPMGRGLSLFFARRRHLDVFSQSQRPTFRYAFPALASEEAFFVYGEYAPDESFGDVSGRPFSFILSSWAYI